MTTIELTTTEAAVASYALHRFAMRARDLADEAAQKATARFFAPKASERFLADAEAAERAIEKLRVARVSKEDK